jgi:hypothetical protein
VLIGPLDERVRDQVIAEARGNPQALLELTRGLTPGELAGGYGLPSVVPVPGRIEENYRRQLALLPAATQLLLLIAAAEPGGDPMLIWRAARHLGVQAEAAEPAAAGGLVEFGRSGARPAVAQGGPLGELRRARAELLRAQLAARPVRALGGLALGHQRV